MRSDEETKRFFSLVIGISILPITLSMIFHQPDDHPLITVPNLINFLIGIVSAGVGGMVAAKVIQQRMYSRSNRTLILSAMSGATSGGALFAVLTEVVKQLQQ